MVGTDSADRLSISSERPEKEEVEPVETDEEEGTVFSPAAPKGVLQVQVPGYRVPVPGGVLQ